MFGDTTRAVATIAMAMAMKIRMSLVNIAMVALPVVVE